MSTPTKNFADTQSAHETIASNIEVNGVEFTASITVNVDQRWGSNDDADGTERSLPGKARGRFIFSEDGRQFLIDDLEVDTSSFYKEDGGDVDEEDITDPEHG